MSVKSSALSCISVIMQLYPQAATLYLDKDADLKFQNYSGMCYFLINYNIMFHCNVNICFVLFTISNRTPES